MNPLAHPPFRYFFLGRICSEFAFQMATVAVAWQAYALTNSPLALGLIGLAEFAPTALLTFAAGHVADRYDRRRVIQVSLGVEALTAAFLAWGSVAGWLTAPQIFAAVAVIGAASAFETPAAAAMLPGAAPAGTLQNASALATGAWQVSTIGAPALGGLLFTLAPGLVYLLMGLLCLVSAVLCAGIRVERAPPPSEPPSLRALFAGAAFVRANPAILGTISLDLFAVLLGGATALLPIFARDILHTGPEGLGLLRGAPAVGALMMTAVLARHAIQRRAGLRMFQAVVIFGLATVVFAVSRSMALSLAALWVMGAADTVSVVIRSSLVQLATPDHMRGRVNAVNFLFINTSNQLGEFESGLTAAWFGTVPAALLGGIGTIVVALLWMKLFPSLRRLERLE